MPSRFSSIFRLKKIDESRQQDEDALWDSVKKLEPIQFRRLIDRYREQVFQFNPNMPDKGLRYAELYSMPQEMQFAIECMPTIQGLLRRYYQQSDVVKFLDFGPGYAAGANLFATLHCSNFLWCKLEVDALDYVDRRKSYSDVCHPKVNYRIGNIDDLDEREKWNIIYCSNVIEHFENPAEIVDKLRVRAMDWLIFYAPFNETQLSMGHKSTISREFFDQFNPVEVELVESLAWKPQQKFGQIRAVIRGRG
jgi:2-polyprenyl-3-methyl-5-hydroxy-6-metoxy-1,4-benzoquinol methylase